MNTLHNTIHDIYVHLQPAICNNKLQCSLSNRLTGFMHDLWDDTKSQLEKRCIRSGSLPYGRQVACRTRVQ